MSVCYIFNIFFIASFFGWVYECAYCTIKTTRWQNRGFLFGPACPIYGCGLVAVKLVFQYLLPWLKTGSWQKEALLRRPDSLRGILLIFLVSAVGSAILEYLTSYLLEKIFRARWWDYSHVPFNLNGRFCLPDTCGFGLAGVVIVGYILPVLQHSFSFRLPLPLEEFLALLFMFLMAGDLALSVSAVTGLLEKIEALESEFDETLESGYDRIGRLQRAAAEKISGATSGAAGKIAGATSGAAGKIAGATSGAAGKLAGAASGAAGAAGKVAGLGRGAACRLLTPLQRNTLMNIERFSSARHQGVAGRMKAVILRRSGREPEKENGAEKRNKRAAR